MIQYIIISVLIFVPTLISIFSLYKYWLGFSLKYTVFSDGDMSIIFSFAYCISNIVLCSALFYYHQYQDNTGGFFAIFFAITVVQNIIWYILGFVLDDGFYQLIPAMFKNFSLREYMLNKRKMK